MICIEVEFLIFATTFRTGLENAFGRLMFTKTHGLHVRELPNIVTQCVILCNICEMFGDHFKSERELHEEPQQSET